MGEKYKYDVSEWSICCVDSVYIMKKIFVDFLGNVLV